MAFKDALGAVGTWSASQGRHAATVRRCPRCHSSIGEFCRIVLEPSGEGKLLLGGYLSSDHTHQERVTDPDLPNTITGPPVPTQRGLAS